MHVSNIALSLRPSWDNLRVFNLTENIDIFKHELSHHLHLENIIYFKLADSYRVNQDNNPRLKDINIALNLHPRIG